MRLRPFLTSAAFATALLATSAYTNTAMAQKAALLSPLTPWALTKVAGSGDQGGYCAMARRFGRNTILTFARNDVEEASVALDFQAPKLKTGENIKIVLDPGAGEQRSYYISPVSQQAFVVRLGRDEKFFEALATTGYLRIEAAGDNYSFNLADIDSGHGKLVSCLDSLGEAGSIDEASAGGGDIQSEIASLRHDVQGLRKENKRLSGLLGQADEDIAADLNGEAEALTQENKNLKSSTGMSAGQPPEGKISINHLSRENKRLQDELSALTLGSGEAVAVHDKITTLEQQNTALRNDLKKGPDTRKWRDTQADMFALKEENRRLQELLEQKSGSFAMVENLENQVQTLHSENNRLLQVAMNDLAPAAGEGDPGAQPPAVPEPPVVTDAPAPPPEQLLPPEAPPAPEAAPPEPPAPVAENPQQKIEELMAQLRDKDAKLVEMTNLTTEIENLKAKNTELEQKLLESVKDKETIASLNERIKQLEQENAALKSQAGGGSADQIAALTVENEGLRTQIDALKKDAELASSSAPGGPSCTAEINKAREEADVARQAEMQGLAKENLTLKQKLAKFVGLGREAEPLDAPQTITESLPEDQPAPEAMPPQRGPGPEQPVPVQEVIVSAPAGATEAQQQEAEMMQHMQGASPQKESISWNSPPLSAPPKHDMPAAEPQQAAIEPEPMPVPAPMPPSSFSIQDVLVSAQIAPAGQIQKIDRASVNGRAAYQWRAGAIYGSAEQRPMTDASMFEGEITQYLDKTRNRCPGDFAASPDDQMQSGPDRIASYEIACVGKNINSSASLLFIDKAGTFTVVAHETSSDKMEDAMTMRDKVLKVVTGQ